MGTVPVTQIHCDRCKGAFTNGVTWMAEQNTVDVCGNCCYLVKCPEEHPLRQGTPLNLGRSIRERNASELKYRDELIAMQKENIMLRKKIHDLQADLAARPAAGFGTPAPGFVTPAAPGFGTPAPAAHGFGTPAPAAPGFGTPAPAAHGFGTPAPSVFAPSNGFKF